MHIDEAAHFTFICGEDEFLVAEEGRAWFLRATKGIQEELSKEVIDGRAGKVEEVSLILDRFAEAVQTQSLFGEQKVVWLKSINFIANSQTGNAKGTLELLERLKSILNGLDASAVSVLITACPIYKVRSFYKWCAQTPNFKLIDTAKDEFSKLGDRIQAVCQKESVSITEGAIQQLIDKVNANTRLVSVEIKKLCVYVGEEGRIDEQTINALVPNFGEGDFFEATDAFFSGNLEWTLEALKRHFFSNSQGRPLLGSLQSRNRLMIQLKILKDSGEIKGSYQLGKNELGRMASKFKHHFDADSAKSNLNVFTQNPFYLGRLFKDSEHFSLKQLVDFQIAFSEVFESIIENPKEQEAVFNQLAIRCLGN